MTTSIVTSKMHDKQNYINFEIIISPFLDGDIHRPNPFSSYSVYIPQFIGIARAPEYS